jgi:hypothetical protein
MDATTTPTTQLTTCDGCGTQVPLADSYYVDGAGQLCTTTCTTPIPAELTGIQPPFWDCKTSGVTPDHGSGTDDRDDVRRGEPG